MTPRKSPFKHKVKSHTRGGIQVSSYERGSGKPKKEAAAGAAASSFKSGYNVTFFLGNAKETYNVAAGNLTAALRAAVPMIQRPIVPKHAQIRRIRG